MDIAPDEQSRHYQSVAQAIAYIKDHVSEQPALKDIAASVNMSEYHFCLLYTSPSPRDS